MKELRVTGFINIVLGLLLALGAVAVGCGPIDEEVDCDANPDDPECTGSDDDDDDSSDGEGESWTFLVYLVGDNDLEPFALQDLGEMAEVGSSDKVNIIVQVDRGDWESGSVVDLADFTSTKRVRVEYNSLVEIEDLGEANMGAPSTLADFIDWGVDAYPADRYAIVFWNHGGDWRGFGWDDSGGNDQLTLDEISSGLASGLSSSGLNKFDLIGFDACLMASVEIIMTVKDYGNYLLASEELEPGHGWDYRSLSGLTAKPTATPKELGGMLLDGYYQHAVAGQTERGVTLSLIDLKKSADLFEMIDSISGSLSADLSGLYQPVAFAHSRGVEYGRGEKPEASHHMYDLLTLVKEIAQDNSGFSAVAGELQTLFSALVIQNVHGVDKEGSEGIGIYFPLRADLYDNNYANVAGMDSWRSFLSAFYGYLQTDSSAPDFTNVDNVADLYEENDGSVTISGTLDPATTSDLYSLVFQFAAYDSNSGGQFVLGEIETPPTLSGSVASFNYDLTAIYLSQGSTGSFAYYTFRPTSDANLWVLSIPLFYYYGGEGYYIDWTIVINVSSGSVVQDAFYVYYESGNVGELTPQSGGAFYPLYYYLDLNNLSNSGWGYFETPFDATAGISIGFESLPLPAVFYLTAYDISGNSDFVYNVLSY